MNKQTLSLVLIGLAAYLFSRRPRYPQFSQAPPAPPRQDNSAFAAWVRFIVDIYGLTSSLWEYGGPFYSISKEEIMDIVGPGYDDYV